MKNLGTSSIAFVTLLAAGAATGAEPATLTEKIRPFLAQYCFDCHSGESPEGNLNLQTLAVDLEDAEVRRRWVILHDRVAKREMPPSSADQPDDEARTKFLETLSQDLTRADLAGREVILRRLNRNEYEKHSSRSVRNLCGLEERPAGRFRGTGVRYDRLQSLAFHRTDDELHRGGRSGAR